jgi:glycosyltransferase involved in cell wall biosynthesis
MKIVITVEQFNPRKGYSEYYLARELTKIGHKVYVITFSWSKSFSRIRLGEGFEVISIPNIGRINGFHILSPIGIINLLKFIKTEKPDVIHCQPVYSQVGLLLILLKDVFHFKCVGSLITGEFYLNSTSKRILFKLGIVAVRLIKNKVDSFFALNNYVALYISRTFCIPYEKIERIPLGADVELFEYNPLKRVFIREKLGIGSDDIVVCYTGRLLPSKQVDILMKALAPIIINNPKVKLLIVGSGDKTYLKYLKEYASRLQIHENVIFHPAVHRCQLPSFYSASDIAVWPAAPSISIIEAASVGLPVISGSPFFYKDYGVCYIVRRGDWFNLMQLINKLIADENLRRNFGLSARNLVKTKFNWKCIAKEYNEAYLKVLYGMKDMQVFT